MKIPDQSCFTTSNLNPHDYLHIMVLTKIFVSGWVRAGGSSTSWPQINMRDPTRKNLSERASRKREKRKKDLTGAECMRKLCILKARKP